MIRKTSRNIRAMAVLSAVALTAGLIVLLTSGAPGVAAARAADVPVRWVYTLPGGEGEEPIGGVGRSYVTVAPNPGPFPSVGLAEAVPGSAHRASRSAVWIGALVASRAIGANIADHAIAVYVEDLDLTEAPDDSALLTVAMMAGMLGDELRDDATITGAIAPDGSIIPTSNLSYKAKAAADAGIRLMLIPAGQRVETLEDGREVDVVSFGDSVGVEVREVGDVYEAYRLMTGHEVPGRDGAAPRSLSLSAAAQEQFERLLESQTGRLDDLLAELRRLRARPDERVSRWQELADQALEAGEPAGAYYFASQAVMAAARQLALTEVEPFFDDNDLDAAFRYADEHLDDLVTLEDGVIESLDAFVPEDMAGVSLRLAAEEAFARGAAFAGMADESISLARDMSKEGQDQESMVFYLLDGITFTRYAEALYRAAEDILASDPGASEIDAPAPGDLERVANQALAGALGVRQYYDAIHLSYLADDERVHLETKRGQLLDSFGYYFAHTLIRKSTTLGMPPYALIAGSGAGTSAMALELAIPVSFDVRYSDQGEIEQITYTEGFERALALAESEAAAAIASALEQGVEPAFSIGLWQAARRLREQSEEDAVESLALFWDAAFVARTLTELAASGR